MKKTRFVKRLHNTENNLHPMGIIDICLDHHPLMAGTYHIPECVKVCSVGHSFVDTYPELGTKFDPVTTVSSYMLVSQGTSQTHWHLDFTGSSVFYTVLSGRKIFFVLQPTTNNRNLLSEYASSDMARQ